MQPVRALRCPAGPTNRRSAGWITPARPGPKPDDRCQTIVRIYRVGYRCNAGVRCRDAAASSSTLISLLDIREINGDRQHAIAAQKCPTRADELRGPTPVAMQRIESFFIPSALSRMEQPVCGVYALGRPAGGSERISTAPALDTAAAVIIVVLPLSRKSSPGPKSFKRIAVWPTTAINAATITGMKSPRRSFL
jgi:hypothetical protein